VAGRNGETAVIALYEVVDGVGCIVVAVSAEPDVSTRLLGLEEIIHICWH